MTSISLTDKFSSFEELDKNVYEFGKKNNSYFYKREAITLQSYYKRRKNAEAAPPELKYFFIKYACIHGGRSFKKRPIDGSRKTKTLKLDCPVYITASLSSDKTTLEIKKMNIEHNHLVTETLFKALSKSKVRSLPKKSQAKVAKLMDLQVLESVKTGTSADKVRVPKLCYYDHMMFIEDQETQQNSKSANSIRDGCPFGDDDNRKEGVPTTSSSPKIMSTPRCIRPRMKADEVLEKIVKRIDAPNNPKQMFSSFGEHIAERMRLMPVSQAPLCQKLISDVIFNAEMNHLNMTSRIHTDYIEEVCISVESQE